MMPRRLAVHALSALTLLACIASGSSLRLASGQQGPGGPAAAAPGESPQSSGQPAADSGPRVKVRVTDPSVGRQLADSGARVVADYGGFQVLEVDTTTAAALVGQAGAEVRDDYDVILLNTGPINTTSPGAAALRTAVGSFPGKRLHLVQFAAPVQPVWLEEIEKTGVQVVTYVPANAYLLYGDGSSLGQVQARARTSPVIQWDGAFLDDYKIHPRAREADDKGAARKIGTDHFVIQMVDDPGPNAATLAVIDALKLAPIVSQDRALGYLNVVVRLPADRLADVAQQPEVVSIQAWVVPTKSDERQNQIVAGNIAGSGPSGPGYLAWLASKGFTQAQFTASNFIVDVSDSGIDDASTTPNHPGLYVSGIAGGTSRVAYNRLEGTPNGGSTQQGCDGHGTLNAHIVAGFNNLAGFPHADAAGFHYGLGVAPFVMVGSSVIFDPNFTNPNLPNLQARAYQDGARISSNSWGAPVEGAYNINSQIFDALVRDAQPTGSAVPTAGNQQMVIVFSAGNNGPRGITTGAPGTAKNVLTVGASENLHSHATAAGGNNAAGNDGCGIADAGASSLDDIISFSSRGPTDDNRVKPDIVAPGTHITGGVFQVPMPAANGTADACFTAVGVCALPGSGFAGDPDDFFPAGQQFYTTSSGTSHSTPAVAGGAALVRQSFINQGAAPPSPAMTKAVLMNSARHLTGVSANDTLPSNNQGMGLLDLGRAFDGMPRILRDQIDLLTASGQSLTFTGRISDPSQPFRVTLAWTDAPGSTVGNAFNNDLDLTVVVGSQIYRGNVFNGAFSLPGGTADPRNNVESVFLPAGVTGAFAVIVTAANVNSNGVPDNASALDQDFALVVYNGVAASIPIPLLQPPTIGTGNGVVDVNECNDVSLPIKNMGSVPATGVFVTLWDDTLGVTIAQPASAYPDIPPGGQAANLTPFKINTGGGFTCGTAIDLMATVRTGQGTFVASLGVPSGGPPFSTTTFESADVPKPILDVSSTESTLAASGLGGVQQVTAALHLTHTFDGDLDLSLVGPDGTTVDLSHNRGGTGDNYGTSCAARTIFDDAAATAIAAGVAPFAGTFRPEQPLAAFIGKSGSAVNGTWRLRIRDEAGEDTGTLQCWSLTVSQPTCDTGAGPCAFVATFADVPEPHPFWQFVETLARIGITSGCAVSPARYCPDSDVTRGQMAVFLLKAKNGAGFTPPVPGQQAFADVPLNHPFAAWIYRLAAEGITGGCAVGPARYCPDQAVTRAQMAVFLLKAKNGAGFTPPVPGQQTFADVPLNNLFAAWIYQLAADGITGGCAVNPARYCPDQAVTRGQMAVFLVRTFNLPLQP